MWEDFYLLSQSSPVQPLRFGNLNNFISHFTGRMIPYPRWDLSKSMSLEGKIVVFHTQSKRVPLVTTYDNLMASSVWIFFLHDDVIKWKLFSAYLAICAGNSPAPVNCPHKGQWHGTLMFSFICVWLSKQSRGWWLETLSHPLWCHCNGLWLNKVSAYERRRHI